MARKTQNALALDKIVRRAKEGACPTPILIQGDEDYRVEEARRRILEAHLPDAEERRTAVETVSAKEMSLPDIVQRACEAPLFASRRALVVRDAEALARGGASEPDGGPRKPARRRGGAAAPGAEGGVWRDLPPEAVVILIARPGLDARTRLFREIAERGEVLTFERPKDEREVADWVDDYVRYRKKTISSEARALLIEQTLSKTGVSLRLLKMELEKLTLYVGERARIERRDVEALVGRSAEEAVWALTQSLADRAPARAIGLLAEFLEGDEEPLGLLARLGGELRQLLAARLLRDRSPEARRAVRMPFDRFEREIFPRLLREAAADAPAARGERLPAGRTDFLSHKPYFVFRKLVEAERFTVEDLLRGLRLMAEADRELKSSGRFPRLVMEDLVVRLAAGGGEP